MTAIAIPVALTEFPEPRHTRLYFRDAVPFASEHAAPAEPDPSAGRNWALTEEQLLTAAEIGARDSDDLQPHTIRALCQWVLDLVGERADATSMLASALAETFRLRQELERQDEENANLRHTLANMVRAGRLTVVVAVVEDEDEDTKVIDVG